MYESYQDFIADFQEWRKSENYPKREKCRSIFRDYRDSENKTVVIPCLEYILKQQKPAMFLDELFGKNSIICTQDKLREKEENTKQVEDKKREIIDFMYEYVKVNNYIPNFTTINTSLGYRVNKYFDTEQEILEQCRVIYSDFNGFVLNENDFTNEYRQNTVKAIKSHNKFFITTAVSGKKICKQLFNSIKNFIECNNAICLVLPCADIANRKSAFNWQLPPELKTEGFYVVHNDTYLNNNIYISDVKVSAKQINPQSGLPQFTQDGSVIIASPKQDLEFIANGSSKIPNAIMTTGAITENDYSNDAFMSQRLNKIAEYEHILGGIVVEIRDDEIFHFRQVQMGANGEIIDLGVEYSGLNTIKPVKKTAIVLGDSHFGEEDEDVIEVEENIIKNLEINDIVMHDVFTGESISHWNRNKMVTLAKKELDNKLSLKDEASMVARCINTFKSLTKGKVYVVDSNHHKFLDRYLESGRYATDCKNTYYSLDIVKAMIEGKEPLEFMLRNKAGLINSKNIIFLQPDQEKEIYGVEISQHGDRGANGAKGNLPTYRKAYKKSVTAHTHTPKIYRGAYCVGTSSRLKLDYNRGGLSSWLHSCCLIYPNGTRQLINIIADQDNNYSWKI